MKKVFVHYKDKQYVVVDKEKGTIIQRIDDVLLFNAKYMRYKTIKGWHGILSDEINLPIIKKLQERFIGLIYLPKIYYPRSSLNKTVPVKEVQFLRLLQGQETYNGQGEVNITPYIEPWRETKRAERFEDIEEDDLIDFDEDV